MLVPVNWLKEYIDIDLDTREIADKLTDSGSHVESIVSLGKSLKGLKVGQILKISKHETLEKLHLVDLDMGQGESLRLVTGAKNMKENDKVVVAGLGACLPGGLVIKEADFAGIKSPGMLCSYEELGIDEALVPKNSKDGIIILPPDVQIGADAVKILGLDTDVIEFEITPNRPDCLSIIGMAREVAAVLDKKVKYPEHRAVDNDIKYSDFFKGIRLESKNVDRFMAGIIKDVVIKESPLYIQNYLRAAGMRPINNIVDFTNFIMLEYGQPLHAYDLESIAQRELIVRQAENEESLITLDNVERKLENTDILICDGENKPIGLAGIMGGLFSEVKDTTKNILIESASFSQDNVRQTSKRLNLRTEASSRFEKGIASPLNKLALERFFDLVTETNSGTVVKEVMDFGNKDFVSNKIRLRNDRVKLLLGMDMVVDKSKKYLENLELEVSQKGDDLEVTVPYFRSDLTIEADLIEEIGRLYGFHNIKPKALEGALTKGLKSPKRNYIDGLRTDLYALGFSEILTYSFISKKQYDKLNVDQDSKLRNTVNIINPLGEDFSVMRTSLLGNMLDVVRKNLNNKQNDLRLSEVGNSFQKDEDGQIYENTLMTLALVGAYDYYYAKDVLENIFKKVGLKAVAFIKDSENPIFHPGRCARLEIEGEVLGYLGQIHPLVAENFDIGKAVYACEINVDLMLKHSDLQVSYKPISKYPLIERDIALVVDREVESQSIIEIIRANGGDILKTVNLFDIYTGSQIEEDKKSLAYKIGFQSDVRTLKDQEVKDKFEDILRALNEKFNVNLRG